MKAELIASFSELVNCIPSGSVISLSGAGGKSTLMFRLGNQIHGTCLLTTTTKVGAQQIFSADQQLTCSFLPEEAINGKTVWVSPSLGPVNGKIYGCGAGEFAVLAQYCAANGYSLVYEADGAARRHIKAPAEHEPVIFPGTTVCIYLAGLDVIGSPLSFETVHRPELFSEITGVPAGSPITPEDLLTLFDHPRGGLKNTPENTLRIAYMTHADTRMRMNSGNYIAQRLENYNYVFISE